MKKYHFFILIFFCQILYGQEDTIIYSEENHRITVLTVDDPCFIMCPCDTVGNYVIYNKKGRIQMRGKTDDSFFINIPLRLKYTPYHYHHTVIRSIFSDNEKTVMVAYYYDQDNEEPVFYNSLYGKLTDERIIKYLEPYLEYNKKNIDKNKYFGYYIFGKYFICYYNVELNNIDLFNYSIRSLRNEK
jgi:hypothetical protein